MTDSDFARTLARWQRAFGRRDLPWQRFSTPYERLVSEVMLQQTQVGTVIPYYERFLARFPTVEALAAAPADELMRLWAGLGYYSRARNLKRAAEQVAGPLGGRFPDTAEGLLELPGVGPSTAAAVAAFTSGEAKLPMVDGNVKRVLARVRMIPGRVGEKSFETAVARAAAELLPGPEDVAAYTQGLMDLGSGVCRRRAPLCPSCPVRGFCRAAFAGRAEDFPAPKKPLVKTVRRLVFGVPVSARGVWLRRGADGGVWAGLWTPVVREVPLNAAGISGPADFGFDEGWEAAPLGAMKRELTHQRLFLDGCALLRTQGSLEAQGFTCFAADPAAWPGMPAPVRIYVERALRAAGYSV